MSDPLLDPILAEAVFPALAILPPVMSSPQAWHMILAAGLQESGLKARCQILQDGSRGPAHGLWQNEIGGVRAVLCNQSTKAYAAQLCAQRGIAADAMAVWTALELDDVLAAGFARLLLWADPKRLPERDDQVGGWLMYLSAWRPGKPRPQEWAAGWTRARQFVYGG